MYYGTLYNCTLTGNHSDREGGGAVRATLNNCTLAGNFGNYGGGGTYLSTLNNCISYYNIPDNNYVCTVSSSCTTPTNEAGNISADPQFVDSTNGNLRLATTSPCIDSGICQDWMASAFDLDGHPRIVNGIVDMGAYEYTPTNPGPRPEVLVDSQFGVLSNRFGFNINWTSGQVVVVDASTNLTQTNWIPLVTGTLSGVPYYFFDSKWTNYIGRFYRIRSP